MLVGTFQRSSVAMEWREQTAIGCESAFSEAQRWMEEVTKKRFVSSNFRSALANGVLLCDLINQLKPGIIKRVNRLSTPIAGLDNVNVFLKACGKLGLNDAQLFHPGDLQDVSTRVAVRHQETSRRLKNVLITIYWLGRKAHADPSYSGPQLNFKAFEGLLGVALSKALEEASCAKSSGFAETWSPDREVPNYRREDSVESLDSVESRTLSVASDCTLKAGSEGFGSDAEAEHCFRMSEPLAASSKEIQNAPGVVRRKRFEHQKEVGRGRVGLIHRSKSMSDLNLEPGAQKPESISSVYLSQIKRNKAATVSLRLEHNRRDRAKLRESEAKWQEDLNRWKTRRWSVNSDLQRKKEEREQHEPVDAGEQRRGLQRETPDTSFISTAEEASSSPLTSGGSRMPGQGPAISTVPAVAHTGFSHANIPIQAATRTPAAASSGSDYGQSVSSSSSSVPASGAEDSGSVHLQHAKSLECVLSGTLQMSAVLPRGFRRSEGTSRLSTGVTPRPFSSKAASRMSAQARFDSVEEPKTGTQELHQLPASIPYQGTDAAPGYKDCIRSSKHSSVLPKTKEDDERRKMDDSAPRIRSFMSASVLVSEKAASASNKDEADHLDMRVSLNQTPGSGTDFGFQASWDSTGARVKSVAPGRPAQLCHLRAGDVIVAVAGQRVAEMSYEQWKANMDAALQEGKLLMDIRRFSLNGHSDDHSNVGSTAGLQRASESEAQLNGHHVNGFVFKAAKARSCDNPVPTKPKGGSVSAISDLQVPSIGSSSSSRWTWNPEEERRRQEKWQMEQEHLLQEKYRRDQERLEEAWRRDQQDAIVEENSTSGASHQIKEVPSLPAGGAVGYISHPFLQQSKSLTAVAPTRSNQGVALVHGKQVQIAAGHPPDDVMKASQCPSESYGFTKLSASDRKKSKSTPSLDGSHRPDSRVSEVSVKKKDRPSPAEQERLQILDEMRKKTPVLTDSSWIRQRSTSTNHKEPIDVAPLRRHESLDNIRSSSAAGVSSSKRVSGSFQMACGLSGIVPYRGYSGRCSLGPGSAIFSSALGQSSWSRPSVPAPVSDTEEEACNRAQQRDSASAAGLRSDQTPNLELRCESDTGSSSVTPVTTDSESVPVFPSDVGASRGIREELFYNSVSNRAAPNPAFSHTNGKCFITD